jgi:hypothetical protein
VVCVPLVKNFVVDLMTLQRHIDAVASIDPAALGIGTDRDGAVLIPEVAQLGWKATISSLYQARHNLNRLIGDTI